MVFVTYTTKRRNNTKTIHNVMICLYTVEVEKFAGLNFHGFHPTKVFTEILSRFLSQKCLLLTRGTYVHRKTFGVLLKTMKTVKV